MLKYSLTENLLTDGADDYMAKMHTGISYDKEAIIADMLRRGSLLTRTDILAVLNGFEESIADIIHGGGTINTPLFNTSFSISGVFEGAMDTFDGNRHKVNVNLNKGVMIRDTEARIVPEKTEPIAAQPQIIEVKDSVSGTVNERLTPGGVLEVWGNNIRIAGDNPGCGFYFVPSSGEAVKVQVVIHNKPTSLIVMIPTLAVGTYTLKLVTQFTHGHLIKLPRTYYFHNTFLVD